VHEGDRVRVVVTGLGVAGWDAVLRTTQSTGMFAEAPFSAFPISWQDGGCGLTALAFTTVVLGCGLRRSAKAVHLVLLGLLCGVAALLTAVYFA
jgi:hypothetical protein